MADSVVFIDRAFPHHGNFSGYKQLARYLEAEVIESGRWSQWLPDPWLYKVPGMHPLWYNRRALEFECSVVSRILRKRRGIFHYLYGEASFKLLGQINGCLGHDYRLAASFHQLPEFFSQRREQLRRLRRLDAVILVSSNQLEFFESFLGLSKISVIPHGVDTEFFSPAEGRRDSEQPFVCLTVGSNYRDCDLHLKVINRVCNSMGKNVEFEIIGDASLTNAFAHGQVRYLTGISDEELKQSYQRADLLLLPLAKATASNALLEGMATGLPILVTDVGGVTDYVDENCAVLTPGDARCMSDRVIELLGDPELRARLGAAARGRAEMKFDWKIIAGQMQEIYDNLC